MKALIDKLEAAPKAEQEQLILEALELACSRGWITPEVTQMAANWLRRGAYLSAAHRDVPGLAGRTA